MFIKSDWSQKNSIVSAILQTWQTCHIMLFHHTEERVNSKHQSGGPTYILLALVKIRLFNLFSGK